MCPSHYLQVHQWRAMDSAVRCRGGGGGGLVVVVVPGGQGPVAIHWHWGGRRASLSAHSPRHSPQSGPGLRALRPRGSSGVAGGGRTRWSHPSRRKACTPSRASSAKRGGAGHGCCPVEVGGGDPQDPLWVSAGRDGEEEQGGARALLPEGLPSVVGALRPGEGGGRFWWAQPRDAWVAGGRAGHQLRLLGNSSHTTAYRGVGLVLSRDVADPSPVCRRVSPMDRSRLDWLDLRQSIHYQ